ncbi:MAG: UbiA prenyltransferase family protein, partial [Gemmatimonadota bacterium]|jgi:4-hydroxybenzoate polyprenyltransferase|nr:UbiA prenyltransferase family protein [Gemmatimonadota bacterium]
VLAGLFAAFRAGPRFGQAAVAFLLLNGMYSLWLKRHAMIDVMCISVSFLIRAIAGVRILQDADPTVALSNWLLLCTFFLALFLGFGKRRSELVLLEGDASEHRASLGEYSVELLDMVISIVTTSAILSFSIYTIWPETIANLGTDKLVYTVPVVMYGFLRYLFLIRERGLGGNPSEILFRDPPLLAGVVAWVVAVVGLLYLR